MGFTGYKYHEGDKIGPYETILLERTNTKRGKRSDYYCKFLCSFCGTKFYSTISSVSSGHCRSCGCQQREAAIQLGKNKRYDLLGKRFGKLIVIQDSNRRTKDRHAYWKCQCDCGNICEVSSRELLNGSTASCGCLRSKGEQKIQDILQKNNVLFYPQYSFNDCINPKTGWKLKFDFYLPDYNCCIEYDGKQHFEQSKGSWCKESLESRQNKDKIKNDYCKKKGIKLIRIAYTEFENITFSYIRSKGLIE